MKPKPANEPGVPVTWFL